jgi:hypothetical protein
VSSSSSDTIGRRWFAVADSGGLPLFPTNGQGGAQTALSGRKIVRTILGAISVLSQPTSTGTLVVTDGLGNTLFSSSIFGSGGTASRGWDDMDLEFDRGLGAFWQSGTIGPLTSAVISYREVWPSQEFTPAPQFTDVSPDTGSTIGGDTVSLIGLSFSLIEFDINEILFDADSSPAFAYVGPGEISAETPGHAAGPVDVTIRTNTYGDLVLTGAFTYV